MRNPVELYRSSTDASGMILSGVDESLDPSPGSLRGDVSGEVISEFGQQSSNDASVKPSPFLPRFLDENNFHPFTFALDVNLKNPILVNNSLLQSSVSGHVKAAGTPDRLLMNGSFTPLPGGKVLFHDAPFDIGSAYVEYNNNPPGDPKIYLTATSRVSESVVDEQGRASQNQYDVNMLVQGHGQNPQLTLSSQPPQC